MRVLYFVRARYPEHEIIVYSDARGYATQLTVASWSPFVSRVVPVAQIDTPPDGLSMGRLDRVHPSDLVRMVSADLFLDAFKRSLMTDAAAALNVSVFEILAHRPELSLPAEAHEQARAILAPYGEAIITAINLANLLAVADPALAEYVVSRLLEVHPHAIVLNFFASHYAFPHWPDDAQRYASRGCEVITRR